MYKTIFISIVLSLLLTNYVEMIETPYAKKIRNLFYYGTVSDRKDGKVKYRFDKNNEHFNPVSLALESLSDSQCVLSRYYTALPLLDCDNKTVNEERIITSANKIITKIIYKEHNNVEFGLLEYNFYLPIYKLNPPWYSGMAQGFSLEILLAAYKLTGNTVFLSNAIYLGNAFKIDTVNEGLKVNVEGGYWYEEYASPIKKNTPLVLNGHNFVLDSLYTLSQEDKSFKVYLDNGISALVKNIDQYFSLFWTYYDKKHNIADKKYHIIHIEQLERISKISSNNDLNPAIDKMKLRNNLPFGFIERLIVKHNRMTVFLFLFNALIIYLLFILIRRKF